METPFTNILNAVKSFRDNVATHVIDSVRPHESEVIRLNTDEQLLERGIETTGAYITPPYTPFTVKIKKQKGQEADHVTLKDEGDYHRSKRLVFSGDQFEMVADDPKADDLRKKYGKEIEGLTSENLQYLIDEFLREEMQRKFQNALAV